jgi:hypothetical protein
MEMQNHMLLMIERMLTRQEEARQEKAEADVKARHETAARQEKATSELKAGSQGRGLPRKDEGRCKCQHRSQPGKGECQIEGRSALHADDIERSVQKQVEDVLSVLNRKTQSLQMDLTEKIESTQVKLETKELSLGVETNNHRLDLSNIQAETISNRQATSERIEAVRREFHTRLEEAKEMAGHTHGTGNGICAVTPPKFDGTTS